MKYKSHPQIKYSYPLIALLDNHSLDIVNGLFGTHYIRQKTQARARITPCEQEDEFYEKLMKEKPRP